MQTVKSATDLVTRRAATIRGFEWQAREKHRRAKAFVELAEYFNEKADHIKNIDDVRNDPKLTEFCIASAMLSRKSLSHLSIDMQDDILRDLIDFDLLTDPKYVSNLQGRYFLTSGDSLGGTMRNVVGQAAQERLTNAIIEALREKGANPTLIKNPAKTKITAIKWTDRQVLFDKKPKFVNKSIDFIVVKGRSSITGNLESPGDYVACGELKGGIDPAGADEHWKTAKSALDRIREAFITKEKAVPKLIFIGSAIEQAMATEIYGLLTAGWLGGVANATVQAQFDEVVQIIIS